MSPEGATNGGAAVTRPAESMRHTDRNTPQPLFRVTNVSERFAACCRSKDDDVTHIVRTVYQSHAPRGKQVEINWQICSFSADDIGRRYCAKGEFSGGRP